MNILGIDLCQNKKAAPPPPPPKRSMVNIPLNMSKQGKEAI